MNLETAKLFCDLVELKNFSRAAELHGVSQSAVSQQIAQIEMDHKIQLFDRKKRPVELTTSGELFYRACKDILERYNRLSNELAQLNQTTCSIHLAAIFSIGMHTLQPYIKKFMAIYPDVNLSIEYDNAKEIYEKLLRGSIDIGVVALPRRDRNIQNFPFENEPLLLVCSPDHPFASETEVEIHRLQGEKFIAFASDVPTRSLIDSILTRYGINVRVIMEFDNIETIKRAVEINSGISILPKSSLRMELSGGSLKAIPFANETFYRPTGIIVRKDRTLSKAARYLIELMRKDFEADV
ncbi:MAG TPA: LysR family transcriptional regulator [Anaerohalosphaeraceae bacterium]|jgi:DNA-binding transcriptional LysR family regulator|nr:LysR family transcriptional regulator [Anaerohalosphaeraceae bacterium]